MDPNLVTDGSTFVNSFGLTFTLVMSLLIVIVPRRWALVPVLILVCYMTMGMRVVVLDFNFTMLRVLLLFGWARLLVRREIPKIRFNSLDKLLIAWALCGIAVYTLLWGNYDAFKFKLGIAYNAIGFYFLFRFLLLGMEDVLRLLRVLALLLAPLAALMVLEKMTGRNAFGVFGGTPAITVTRDGVLRCQGPFGHPILAGTFGATLIPLFVGLWWQKKGSRAVALVGLISAALIILTTGSSGPVVAAMSGMVGLGMWMFRKQMRMIRWGIVLTLLVLQMVMKAPVWFIVARVSVFNASDGWHRAFLIDRALANIGDWWLVGTRSTEAWGFWLFDVTNQYLREAADGGLLVMLLFIAILVQGYRRLGKAVRVASADEPETVPRFLWALAAALLVHTVTFLSVAYFDQNVVNWYMLLAVIACLTGQFLEREEVKSPVPAPRLRPLAARTPSFSRGRATLGPVPPRDSSR